MRRLSIFQWIMTIIAVLAAVAILYIATNAMGVPIPPWAIQIGWVVAIAVLAIAAIGFLASWFGGGPGPTP